MTNSDGTSVKPDVNVYAPRCYGDCREAATEKIQANKIANLFEIMFDDW